MSVSTARRRARSALTFGAAATLCMSALATTGSASGAAAATSHGAHSARHWSATCPAPYPLRKVHAGLRGTGWTTFKGETPKRFSVRVLGVLHDGIAPGIDLIVIATHSRMIRRDGTWEGMSGSPIYARDGRLIGALSYGLSFGATNTAGVTPAAAMYQLLSDRNARSARYAKQVAVPSHMRSHMRGGDSSGADQSSGDLRLLPTPITVAGLPVDQLSVLRQRLQHAGAAPFSLHVGGDQGVRRRGSRSSIRPGAPFAATIAYGDYTLGGVGTVTAVCGSKVLAFGHPLLMGGATTEGANAAQVLYVQRDPAGPSFVMANIGPSVGTLDQDRVQGVRASLGATPSATRIVTHVVAPGTGLRRTGVTYTPLAEEVADATAGSTFGNLIATVQSEGPGSATYSWTASGRLDNGTPWTFHRSDQVTDPYDVEFGTVFPLYITLGTILSNPFDAVTVKQVTVHAQASETVKEWELRDLSVEQGGVWQDVTPSTTINVSPGDTLQLSATLQAYQDSQETRHVAITVAIPADAGSGPGTIQVAGGGDLEQLGVDPTTVTSFDDLLKALRTMPHGNDLVTQLTVPDSTGNSTITNTQHDRLERVTRGTLTLQLNVGQPGDSGDGGPPSAGGPPSP